jgi:large subunit ribosomal protein L14e
MPFTRYVEIGRVALINYGPNTGKLCTIIDIVDQSRVLVDGPTKFTGISRQIVPLKRIALTDIKVKIGMNARQKSLEKAWTRDDVLNKWNNTTWAKKIAAKKTRATNNDFTRYKLAAAKRKRNKAVSAML